MRLDELRDSKFMFSVQGLGRSIKSREKVEMINTFKESGLIEENVDLENPEVVFKLLDDARNNEIIFGKLVAANKEAGGLSSSGNTTFHRKYDLKTRPYLSPTCLDHELSFLMANQA